MWIFILISWETFKTLILSKLLIYLKGKATDVDFSVFRSNKANDKNSQSLKSVPNFIQIKHTAHFLPRSEQTHFQPPGEARLAK